MKKKQRSTRLILSALFAALICVGAFIHIPLPGGVPIAVQDMLAMLSGMLLGPIYGSLSVLLFLIIGCLGLPVFTGKAGIQVLIAGPTSGFLCGYLIAAFAGGLFLALLLPRQTAKSTAASYVIISLAALISTIVVFVCGITGFTLVMHTELSRTLAAVLIPFIPGNIIKMIIMVPVTKKFRPIIFAYTGEQ